MLKLVYFLLPAASCVSSQSLAPQAGLLADRRGLPGPAPQDCPSLVSAADFCAGVGPYASPLLFVEYHPAVDPIPTSEFTEALAARPEGLETVLVTGDMNCALELARARARLTAVALKPCEAAGLGSTESAGVLFDNARAHLADLGLPLLLWGGVATPEAAAAFLATGAAGVVVEQAHWLTSDVPLAPPLRERLHGLKTGTSASVPAPQGLQWRLFDKGNSRAVRRLREMPPAEAARAVAAEAKSLAASSLSADELIPLGADAVFAVGFVQRFGLGTVQALNRFTADALRLWSGAADAYKRFLAGPAANALGTKLPVIQGGMSWISDSLDFARAVAESGALPTLAVGMRSPAMMDGDFGQLAAAMQGLPYAMNVLVLEENPQRAGQLAWLKAHRPPFVAVAAGDPAFAGALRREGLEVIYLAADIGLMRLALAAGVRFVVLEGCEAGGHVGSRTLLELAQEALMLRRQEPGLLREAFVVLAGGICGGPSALRAALLGADAVQMGTVYLGTCEIVSTGALRPLYQQQILAARLGATRISGESVGLRVRALDTPKVRAICALELERGRGGLDEAAFRRELEALSVGSLLVAARGVSKRGGEALPPGFCAAEGQFMSGAVAANVDSVRTVAEVHGAIASAVGGLVPAPSREAAAQQGGRERIAITGMALANSLGDDVDAVVQASLAGKSGIGTVPKERWDHSRHHTPGQARQGRTYTDVGAFMSLELPRKALGVSPQDYRTMSMSTKLTLLLARRAIAAAGLVGSLVPGSRVAVLTSQNSAEVASPVRAQLFNTYAGDIGDIAWRAADLTLEQRSAVERELAKEGQPLDDTTLIGRLNCTASGHICNQFGFGGPSYSVGAACASSLIALYNAVLLLRAGIIDAAVVGGGEEVITPVHYLEFSALRALAGLDPRLRTPAEHSRPFDRDRDGFVLGEGGAVIVLERESLARERGAPIHAFITGVGACTNHQGIVESVAESQMLALEASYVDAGYGLDEVDLVECHGTGTVQGDREEARALVGMLRGCAHQGGAVLSSFKSQIGHTLGASGVSSLIRGVGAMRRGMFPPTNNFVKSDPSMGLEESGLRLLSRAEPWPRPEHRTRRMQVNAFGFGGACVVVQMEAPSELPDIPFELPEDLRDKNLGDVGFHTTSVDGRPFRLALCGAPFDAAEFLRQALAEGVTPAAVARLARKGIFLGPEDDPRQPLALVFSGQGEFYKGMGREIARAHPAAAQALDRLAAFADYDLKALLFDTDEETLRDTRWQQPALFALQYALASQVLASGVKPYAAAGHSLGEFAALTVAGVLTPEDAFRVVDMRARCMAKAAGLAPASGMMAAVGLPVDVLQWKMAKHPGVVITNYNTPKQVVVGGDEAAVRALVEEIKAKGGQATLLKVSMAFHSPVMRVIRQEFAAFLQTVNFSAPNIPVMSNVLKGPFPGDPEAIRQIMVEHLEKPVHWMQNVYYLWSELGVRRFVELGPGAVLCGLVRDIEGEAQTLRTASREQEAQTFGAALATLYAWGELAPPAPPSFLELGRRDEATPAKNSGSQATDGGGDKAQDVLERTIRIIMDATGYEREEIEPDMDLRKDLAIRSSRLPVIMDTAERDFGFTMRIEDFIGVNTVRQMAEQIEALLASGGGAEAAPKHTTATAKQAPAQRSGLLPVTRYEAGETQLATGEPLDMSALAGQTAWVLSAGDPKGGVLPDSLGQALALAHGLAPAIGGLDAPPVGADHPACLVFAIETGSVDAQSVDALLLHSFRRLKEFMTSPARKACVLVLRDAPHGSPERQVFEGVLGLLLTLAQEYRTLAWRALRVARDVEMAAAVAACLAVPGPVERMVRAGALSTPQYRPVPLRSACAKGPALGRGDVVLVSGGARGVTYRLLEELAPLGPHFLLLGRSPGGEPEAQAVARLKELGADSEYLSCDVSDAARVRQTVADAAARLGRVDAVIHGAGLLRDSFLSMMTEADFEAVCRVKLSGLRNLVDAARPHGLRLAVGFSSVAAWQGNVGQGNYCCANRAMASLLEGLNSGPMTAKALWLPPVAGVGMADTQDIREMMELKGLGQAYVHIDELAPVAAREIACPEASGPSVLIARHMPQTASVEFLRLPVGDAEAGLVLPVDRLPMLDTALLINLSPQKVACSRRISHQRDLWLAEHRPYAALDAPLFSAVMVVESFCETALALCPQLAPVGVRGMRFLDMLACPANQEREILIEASRAGVDDGLVLVDAEMKSEELSPRGRSLGRFTTHFEGSVLLAGGRGPLSPLPAFADALKLDPDSGADDAALLGLYAAHTAQTGRYRVLERIEGTAAEGVVGSMRYRLSRDVADTDAPLCTPPYVLEALMQLALFHGLLRRADASTGFLPVGLAEMRFAQLCHDGERLRLEARLRESQPSMQIWDACAFDSQNLVVMRAEGLVMRALAAQPER